MLDSPVKQQRHQTTGPHEWVFGWISAPPGCDGERRVCNASARVQSVSGAAQSTGLPSQSPLDVVWLENSEERRKRSVESTDIAEMTPEILSALRNIHKKVEENTRAQRHNRRNSDLSVVIYRKREGIWFSSSFRWLIQRLWENAPSKLRPAQHKIEQHPQIHQHIKQLYIASLHIS